MNSRALWCAAHRLQNAVKGAVQKKNMQHLLAKCRRLVGHFKHSALATNGLDQKQKALGFKPVCHVVQEVATRWNSTFRMLQRLVLLKQPIHLYLEDNMSEKERASYDQTDSEWASAKSVLSLLEAIDEVTWRIVLHSLLVPSANVRSSGQSRHRFPALVHARWH